MKVVNTGPQAIAGQGREIKPEVKTGEARSARKNQKSAPRRMSRKDAVVLGAKTAVKGMVPVAFKKLARGEKPTKYEAIQALGTIAIYTGIGAGGLAGLAALSAGRVARYGSLGVQHRKKLAKLAKAAGKKLNPKNLAKAIKNGDAKAVLKQLGHPGELLKKVNQKQLLIAGTMLAVGLAVGIGISELENVGIAYAADVAASLEGTGNAVAGVTPESYTWHPDWFSKLFGATDQHNGDLSHNLFGDVSSIEINGYNYDAHLVDGVPHFELHGHEYVWQDGHMYLEGGLKNTDNLTATPELVHDHQPNTWLGEAHHDNGEVDWKGSESGPTIYISGDYYRAWPDGDAWHFNYPDGQYGDTHEFLWKNGQMYRVGDWDGKYVHEYTQVISTGKTTTCYPVYEKY